MGPPAAVLNDQVNGMCVHLVPAPPGPPVPTPMPFAGPLVEGLATTVLIGGAPAAVVGSVAYAVPPHVGIVDAFAAPPMQRGTVIAGSATVMLEGRPAARSGSSCSTCTGTGTLTGTAATVMVGG